MLISNLVLQRSYPMFYLGRPSIIQSLRKNCHLLRSEAIFAHFLWAVSTDKDLALTNANRNCLVIDSESR